MMNTMMDKMDNVLEMMSDNMNIPWWTVVEDHTDTLKNNIMKIDGMTSDIFDKWFTDVAMDI